MKIKIGDVEDLIFQYKTKTYIELDMICCLKFGVKISELYQAALSALDYHMDLYARCEDYYYNHKFKTVPEKIIFEI